MIHDPRLFQHGLAADWRGGRADGGAGAVLDGQAAVSTLRGPIDEIGQIGREEVAVEPEAGSADFEAVLQIVPLVGCEILPVHRGVSDLDVNPGPKDEIAVVALDEEAIIGMASGDAHVAVEHLAVRGGIGLDGIDGLLLRSGLEGGLLGLETLDLRLQGIDLRLHCTSVIRGRVRRRIRRESGSADKSQYASQRTGDNRR